ncbi:hypothetical protein BVY01_04290 [bacterium I07]|nr:hypothetical protein BVY01_04290 [bacterium I07]
MYIIEDREGKAEIENTLQILESKYLRKTIDHPDPILPPPPADQIQGPIEIGEVLYGGNKHGTFGLQLSELPSHICITGATGKGKSNICFHIIKNLLREDIKWCLFDFKRSARDLLADPVPFNRDILVFTVGRDTCPFTFNPLIPPPGLDPRTWIDRVVDLITKIQYVGFGVASLLRKAIDHVYREVGLYGPGPLISQPTLKEALKYLRNYQPKAREINWMQSCLRTLEALCFGEMGKILNSGHPLDLECILEKNVIFELDALSISNKTFIIESIMTWFHAYRLFHGGDEKLKHVTFVEEAHRILKQSNHQSSSHDSILDIWITEARQLGESLVILAQTPSILPAIALGNTYTSVCLNLKHSSDINTMSRVLLLPQDQKDCLGRLSLGKAVVKLQGRWLSPFLVDIPLYPVQKGSVNDSRLKELMTTHFSDSGSKSTQYLKTDRFRLSPPNDKYKNKLYEMENNKMKLSEEEKRLLKDIWEYPGSGVVERYKRLKMSRRKGNKAKLKLLKIQCIKEIPIITNRGKVMLLELTKMGWKILKDSDEKLIRRKRSGGAVHEYWKVQIARYYRNKGLKVIKEMPVNGGRTADLCVLNKGKRIAIEIETGKSDSIGNIKKDLKAGFDEVISIAVDEGTYEKLKNTKKRIFTSTEKVIIACTKNY